MHNQETEITLGMLGKVFKKNLIRGLIYILASAIIVCSVLLCVRAFTVRKSYVATVAVASANENTLAGMNNHKSNVVHQALKDTYSDSEKILELYDGVVKNLSVTAIVPDTIKNTDTYVPNSFELSLSADAELNLSSAEYKNILDNVAKEYVNKFATIGMPAFSFVYDINAKLNGIEYLQIVYELSDYINEFSYSINSFAKSNPTAAEYRDNVTNKNLYDLAAQITAIDSELSNLKPLIVTKRVENIDGLEGYIAFAKSQAAGQVTSYTTLLSDAQNNITNYRSMIENMTKVGSDQVVYNFAGDDTYIKLCNISDGYAKSKAQAEIKKQEFDGYTISGAKCTDANIINNVKSTLTNCAASINSSLAEYKKIAEDFNGNKATVSGAKVTKNSTAAGESFITNNLLVVTTIAIALICYVVSYCQTYSKMKKDGSLFGENNIAVSETQE